MNRHYQSYSYPFPQYLYAIQAVGVTVLSMDSVSRAQIPPAIASSNADVEIDCGRVGRRTSDRSAVLRAIDSKVAMLFETGIAPARSRTWS